jgi:hypothetical protein
MSKGAIVDSDLSEFTIGFGDLKDGVVGVCKLMSKKITIDRKYWFRISENSKMEIFLHEVGHCILKRYHTNPKGSYWHDLPLSMGFIKNTGYLKDGCPTSIMHPYVLDWYCFYKHRNYYIEELFNRTDKNSYEPINWGFESGTIQISR